MFLWKKVFLCLFLVIIFFSFLIFTNLTYFQRDLRYLFKPWKIFINNSLSNIKYSSSYLDFLPLWNPYNHCGSPFIASAQPQFFYPLSIIFLIFKDFSLSYKIFIIIHFFLSLIFMFFFLEKKNFSFASCLLGSIIWSFNGYMISRTEFLSVLSTVVWFPLVIYLFSLIENFDLKKIIFVSLALAVQFLAGHSQIWVYSSLFFILYSLYLQHVKKIKNLFLISIVCIIFSLFISAIQFLPTAEFFYHSNRTGEGIKNIQQFGMNYSESLVGFLSLKDFSNFIYPFDWEADVEKFYKSGFYLPNYWRYSFYVGIIGFILAIIGFFYMGMKEKIFYLFVFWITLLYSCIGSFPQIYQFFYKFFPFVRVFRNHAQIIFIDIFVLSLAATYGMEYLNKVFKNLKIKTLILLLLPTLSFCELQYYCYKTSLVFRKDILYEKGEITDFLIKKNIEDNFNFRFASTPLTEKKLFSSSITGHSLYEVSVKAHDLLPGFVNLEYNIFCFRLGRLAYDIEPKNFRKFVNFLSSRKTIDDALPLYSIANTKYIISDIEQKSKYLKLLKEKEGVRIYENPFALKRVYFVDNIIFEPNLEKSLSIMENLKFDLLNTAVVHSNENISLLSNGKSKKNIVYFKQELNKIFIKIISDKLSFLVISQTYSPGWRCKINNKPTKIYQCNIFMQGIFVPEGESEVFLYYSPMSFKLGAILSFISISIMLSVVLKKPITNQLITNN